MAPLKRFLLCLFITFSPVTPQEANTTAGSSLQKKDNDVKIVQLSEIDMENSIRRAAYHFRGISTTENYNFIVVAVSDHLLDLLEDHPEYLNGARPGSSILVLKDKSQLPLSSAQVKEMFRRMKLVVETITTRQPTELSTTTTTATTTMAPRTTTTTTPPLLSTAKTTTTTTTVLPATTTTATTTMAPRTTTTTPPLLSTAKTTTTTAFTKTTEPGSLSLSSCQERELIKRILRLLGANVIINCKTSLPLSKEQIRNAATLLTRDANGIITLNGEPMAMLINREVQYVRPGFVDLILEALGLTSPTYSFTDLEEAFINTVVLMDLEYSYEKHKAQFSKYNTPPRLSQRTTRFEFHEEVQAGLRSYLKQLRHHRFASLKCNKVLRGLKLGKDGPKLTRKLLDKLMREVLYIIKTEDEIARDALKIAHGLEVAPVSEELAIAVKDFLAFKREGIVVIDDGNDRITDVLSKKQRYRILLRILYLLASQPERSAKQPTSSPNKENSEFSKEYRNFKKIVFLHTNTNSNMLPKICDNRDSSPGLNIIDDIVFIGPLSTKITEEVKSPYIFASPRLPGRSEAPREYYYQIPKSLFQQLKGKFNKEECNASSHHL